MSKRGHQRHKHLTRDEIEQIDNVAEIVERVKAEPGASQQPRFAPDPTKFFHSTVAWLQRAETQEPPYASDSRKRDRWLREFIKFEPHLTGVLSSITSVNANRAWAITGGRNQVNRYSQIFHAYQVAPDLTGWRPGIAAATEAYYTSDLGTAVETGREGPGGPLRALYHLDPARCRLTGKLDRPLAYQPSVGGMQLWTGDDYFRITSLPSTDEAFNGLGFCFISRALELAKLMVAVLLHDQEQLAARAPKGLLLLHGIEQTQWEEAMRARREKLEGEGWRFYEGVAVLASAGVDQIDAKLVALSQLPANFDMKQFTDLLMYGYALCSGFDPREFWPVSSGALGTAMETETQHRKATLKGGGDFTLSFQEKLQDQLPAALHFEFEQRDIQGEIADANAALAKLQVVTQAYATGDPTGRAPLINLDEARQLLVLARIIPPEWTELEEDVTATDAGERPVSRSAYLDRLRGLPQVRRAAEAFPAEPIVRYVWPANQVETLWDCGADALRQQVWRAGLTLYKGKGWKLKPADVKKIMAGAKGELGQVLQAATA